FVHFNKQAMRDYYRIMHSGWMNAVNEAKKLAAQSGAAFTEILSKGQAAGKYPANPVIDKTFLDLQKQKFQMIQGFIKDQDQDLRQEAEKIARAEIDYYASAKRLGEYGELNSE
ncbi:MAG: hypothetical protein OEU95_05785, partial [Nitrospirota bacterium]|nr:hypothetical protein [Nitrospirota bacterium]